MLIGGGVSATFSMIDPSLNSWGFLIGYVLPFVLLIGFIFLYRGNFGSEPDAMPATFKKQPTSVLLLLFVITPCLSVLIEPLVSWIPYPSWFDFESLIKNIVKTNVPSFLAIVIAAPVCEEWLMRGIILRGLLKHRKPWSAILWSAFLFGLMHLNPWQGIPAICLGIFFGWVYWRTGSLWLCIFMHFVNNGLAFLMLCLYPDTDTMADLFGPMYPYLLIIAAFLVLLLGFILYKKIETSNKAENN